MEGVYLKKLRKNQTRNFYEWASKQIQDGGKLSKEINEIKQSLIKLDDERTVLREKFEGLILDDGVGEFYEKNHF